MKDVKGQIFATSVALTFALPSGAAESVDGCSGNRVGLVDPIAKLAVILSSDRVLPIGQLRNFADQRGLSIFDVQQSVVAEVPRADLVGLALEIKKFVGPDITVQVIPVDSMALATQGGGMPSP